LQNPKNRKSTIIFTFWPKNEQFSAKKLNKMENREGAGFLIVFSTKKIYNPKNFLMFFTCEMQGIVMFLNQFQAAK
jgi:hypothetical protein